ncbi:MAG: rRNA maturation RNase YbeY [Planctomycetota bacterium]
MHLEIADRQRELTVDTGIVWEALQTASQEEDRDASLSLAVVDDAEMRRLNDRYLAREGTTDVLSFGYGAGDGPVEAEIVANASEAIRRAASRAHSAHDELLLYVVHGFLHAVGYDDLEPEPAARMHEREREILRRVDRPVND